MVTCACHLSTQKAEEDDQSGIHREILSQEIRIAIIS